ncbi:MAG: hypothetical protein IT306_26350 [Chloroflexi bacterium]|nr:hypothetical protein [Chloroflexota bacterium]
MRRHITLAELEQRISRHTIRRQNEVNLDATDDGRAVQYMALQDILLVGDGHGEVPGWISICDDNSDLLVGKIRVSKGRGPDPGTFTVSADTKDKTLLQEVAGELQQLSKKKIKFVKPQEARDWK